MYKNFECNLTKVHVLLEVSLHIHLNFFLYSCYHRLKLWASLWFENLFKSPICFRKFQILKNKLAAILIFIYLWCIGVDIMQTTNCLEGFFFLMTRVSLCYLFNRSNPQHMCANTHTALVKQGRGIKVSNARPWRANSSLVPTTKHPGGLFGMIWNIGWLFIVDG